jgi:hypothetical protein
VARAGAAACLGKHARSQAVGLRGGWGSGGWVMSEWVSGWLGFLLRIDWRSREGSSPEGADLLSSN